MSSSARLCSGSRAELQPADDVEQERGGARPPRQRHRPVAVDRDRAELRLHGLRELEQKAGRQDARDQHLTPLNRGCAPDDARVALKPPLEVCVRKDEDIALARSRQSAEDGTRRRYVPEVVAHPDEPRLLGGFRRHHRLLRALVRGELLEGCGRLFPPDLKIGEADRLHATRQSDAIHRHRHEAIRVRIRERPQQHGVEDAEDDGIQADAEGEREDHHRAEGRCAPQHAQAVARVLGQLVDPDWYPDRAGVFHRHRDVAEGAQRGGARCLRRHAPIDVVLRFALEMILDVVVEAVERMARGHAGLRMRAMAPASFSHLVVSTASCFRPLGVSR
jgi:hypothetical protein